MIMLIGFVMMAVLLIIYMALIEPNLLVKHHVWLSGEIQDEELCIVQFSDTHFHRHCSIRKCERLMTEINALDPDLIVFSGDLMDHYEKTPQLAHRLPPYLARLTARLGKIAVYGNHDIGGGAKDVYPQMMEQSGFQLLCNQSVVYEAAKVAVLGVDDMLVGYEDRTLGKQRLQPYQILVSHGPDLVDDMDMSHIDLMMSGHTHGGQIYLPWITQKILPKGGRNYRKGLYQKGGTALFVSSGIGMTSLPLRLGNPPQLVVYHIKKRNSTSKTGKGDL